MSDRLVTIINEERNGDVQRLEVVGGQILQMQIEQDMQDAYIDLSRNEARELARVLLELCDEAEQ